ncbi:hypothetical protein TNCV_2653821 [Trichonephila clavipes]|nr:hypothetical protein TNCV_2653821 [Trichonephila clavipes]
MLFMKEKVSTTVQLAVSNELSLSRSSLASRISGSGGRLGEVVFFSRPLVVGAMSDENTPQHLEVHMGLGTVLYYLFKEAAVGMNLKRSGARTKTHDQDHLATTQAVWVVVEVLLRGDTVKLMEQYLFQVEDTRSPGDQSRNFKPRSSYEGDTWINTSFETSASRQQVLILDRFYLYQPFCKVPTVMLTQD